MKKVFIVSYIFLIIGLFLYSYTQVDLALTLSRVSIYQTVEKYFQYVGYFQRPLATYLYVSLLVLLFLFYGIFMYLSAKKSFTLKQVWILVIIMTVILTFSYNAFSYDLFNYIFDAKLLTHYHVNPYLYSALNFPKDPMLSFMHWTQRTYPYGPVWLLLTAPISFIGLNIFLPTFFLFKMLISTAFLGTVWLIQKISEKIEPSYTLLTLVSFVFNPLVIIECLVSSHHEIIQAFFALAGLYLLINNKNVRSLFMIILSIGIKYATVFLVPSFVLVLISRKMRIKFDWLIYFFWTSVIMIIPVILEAIRSNFQPWYILNIIPFAVFIARKYYVSIPLFVIAFFSLLEYVPFLYTGNWNPPIPVILNDLSIAGISFSLLGIIIWKIRIAIIASKQIQ